MDSKTLKAQLDTKRTAVAEIRRQAGAEFDLMQTTLTGETVELRSAALSTMMDEVESLQTKFDEQDKLETALRANEQIVNAGTRVANALPSMSEGVPGAKTRKFSVPATARRNGTLKCFRGEDAEAKAYAFGAAFVAAVFKRDYALRYCEEHGIQLQVEDGKNLRDLSTLGNESVNTLGGVLVPSVLMPDIIDLRESYGVARQHVKIVSMSSEILNFPYRLSGLTGAWAGEGDKAIFDKKKWGLVELIAKKYMVGGIISNELSADALINVGDDLAKEIAYQFAFNEDNSIFMGDGSSTYGGIIGVLPKIGSVASNKGIVVAGQAGGADYHSLTITDFENMEGALPAYALPTAKWYMSQTFYTQTAKRIQNAAGGNTNITLSDGVPAKTFMGYPVVISQVLPTAAATSQLACFFGALERSTILGDRNMISIKTTADGAGMFESDSIAVLGIQRIAAVTHSPGTATVAGPVVALKTYAS